MRWVQFTIWKKGVTDRFSISALADFIPNFHRLNVNRIVRWHYLFEPTVLVRVQTRSENDVLENARKLALRYGYEFAFGDITRSSPSGHHGKYFFGEHKFYKSKSLWEANADFLHACCTLAVHMGVFKGKQHRRFARKHVHLLCNILGMNYRQERDFLRWSASRAEKLFKLRGYQ